MLNFQKSISLQDLDFLSCELTFGVVNWRSFRGLFKPAQRPGSNFILQRPPVCVCAVSEGDHPACFSSRLARCLRQTTTWRSRPTTRTEAPRPLRWPCWRAAAQSALLNLLLLLCTSLTRGRSLPRPERSRPRPGTSRFSRRHSPTRSSRQLCLSFQRAPGALWRRATHASRCDFPFVLCKRPLHLSDLHIRARNTGV